MKGHPQSPEARVKISAGLRGRVCSPKTRARMSAAQRGNHKGLGVKRSPETCARISAGLTGLKWSAARRQKFSGANSPEWNGGRTINSKDYVLLYRLSHPRANSRGYVYEHRLVMEAHLGRYLLAEETVHHKNGNPQDNRIENLFLFHTHSAHMAFHRALKAIVDLAIDLGIRLKKETGGRG